MIAMIEAPFGTAAMPLTRGADRGAAGRLPTRRRAIRMAAITRGADRKEAIAASTDFLAKRRVHDVEAAARFDWTRLANRGTRETTGSVRRSIEAVTEGLEHHLQAFTSIRRRTELMRPPRACPNRHRLWTLSELWTHRPRPQLLGKPAQNAGFPQASTATSFLF